MEGYLGLIVPTFCLCFFPEIAPGCMSTSLVLKHNFAAVIILSNLWSSENTVLFSPDVQSSHVVRLFSHADITHSWSCLDSSVFKQFSMPFREVETVFQNRHQHASVWNRKPRKHVLPVCLHYCSSEAWLLCFYWDVTAIDAIAKENIIEYLFYWLGPLTDWQHHHGL